MTVWAGKKMVKKEKRAIPYSCTARLAFCNEQKEGQMQAKPLIMGTVAFFHGILYRG